MFRKILFMSMVIFSISINSVCHASTDRPIITSIEPIDAETILLARCVYAEAKGEGIHGMQMVACVILNRVDSDSFPDTITEVITQTNQFESYSNGAIYKDTPTDEAYEAIRNELDQRSDDSIIAFRTGRYHTYWKPAYKVGNHYFSKE